MGISELVLIALIGLALFGGTINIDFKGVLRRAGGRDLQDASQAPEQKGARSIVKKRKK
ncbi:MAG TPA: hypothetical protein VF591_01950 [Pyrinomonadaceae bacterium]|jgi:hypothetical protein